MKKTDKSPLQIIADASKIPEYSPAAVTRLMSRLDLNERAFALLMNVAPMTVRLWTSGAAKPCSLSRRLMQIFETCPEVVAKLVRPEDGAC